MDHIWYTITALKPTDERVQGRRWCIVRVTEINLNGIINISISAYPFPGSGLQRHANTSYTESSDGKSTLQIGPIPQTVLALLFDFHEFFYNKIRLSQDERDSLLNRFRLRNRNE